MLKPDLLPPLVHKIALTTTVAMALYSDPQLLTNDLVRVTAIVVLSDWVYTLAYAWSKRKKSGADEPAAKPA